MLKSQTISRRDFFGKSGSGALAATFAFTQSTKASEGQIELEKNRLSSVAIPTPDKNIILLNRTSFGIRNEDFERIEEIGYNAYLDEQLDYENVDDKKVDKTVKNLYPSTVYDIDQLDYEERIEIAIELKAATAYRALYSNRQLYEVMVDFWTNHFNVFHFDGPVSVFKTIDDREVIRKHAMGNFKDLLMASAKSPAMLWYLDNYANSKDGPNENYARELLELHTMGVDGGYSQKDVEEVARCFTGWTIDLRRDRGSQGTFAFVPFRHDNGSKKVLGKHIPTGGGIKDGETVIDILASHKSTSEYIATKLVRRFVSDDPPKSLVNKAAKKFRSSDGDITAVLRTILKSKAFKTSYDEKLKRPAEFVYSVIRSLDAELHPEAHRTLLPWLRNMGQLPFDWHPPNGYPDMAAAWVNTNGMINRWNFGLAVGANKILGVRTYYGKMIDSAGVNTGAELVDFFIEQLVHRKMTKSDRAVLLDYVSDSPDSKMNRNKMLQKTPGLVALIIDSPYFQWR